MWWSITELLPKCTEALFAEFITNNRSGWRQLSARLSSPSADTCSCNHSVQPLVLGPRGGAQETREVAEGAGAHPSGTLSRVINPSFAKVAVFRECWFSRLCHSNTERKTKFCLVSLLLNTLQVINTLKVLLIVIKTGPQTNLYWICTMITPLSMTHYTTATEMTMKLSQRLRIWTNSE